LHLLNLVMYRHPKYFKNKNSRDNLSLKKTYS
jgi:hypothetical protein